TRRYFLRNSALAMVGIGSAPIWLQRALYADTPGAREKILVAIFQRGAADGLNVVVPHGEKAYYQLRPTIAIPRPTDDPPKRTPPRSGPRPPSISMASSGFPLRSPRPSRSTIRSISPSSTPPARPTPRARTSTRRTTWSPARQV